MEVKETTSRAKAVKQAPDVTDAGGEKEDKSPPKSAEKPAEKTAGKSDEKAVAKPSAGARKTSAASTRKDAKTSSTTTDDPKTGKTGSVPAQSEAGKPKSSKAAPATPSAPKDGAEGKHGGPEAPSEAERKAEEPAKPVSRSDAKTVRKGGFVPLLLGGAIAAALGFGAARYPDQWPFVSAPAEDPLAATLAQQGAQIAALQQQGKAQGEAIAALQSDDRLNVARGEISGEISQLRTQLEAMSGKIDALEGRLQTVEKLPRGSGMEAAAAAAAAYERELAQMRQMLDAELAKINAAKDDAATLEQNAAEAAKAAGARAALARVLAALDTGKPFGDALFDLTQQADVNVPEALTAQAETGVPTLAALQADFPAAAREALDASIRAAVASGEMDRVSAFLRLQLGTRSLTPKEGADPDAILSRAEAALKAGQIEAALTELSAMPEAAQPALTNWIASATARKNALAAGEALAQLVNSN